jgi:DNA-binding MarR family transcriptional regulator
MSQVWAAPPVGGSQLLVLLALADNADEDRRYAWPSVATLSRKTLLSERSVQRALRDLENDGIIRTVRPGGRVTGGEKRATVYEVLPKGDNLTPTERGMGDTGGSARVTPVTPQPSTEPSVPPGDVCARALPKISGKRVKPEAWALAGEVLAEFNRQAGKKLRLVSANGDASEAAKRVYGRVVKYADLELEDYADIIRRTLASRWWGDGEPTPGVVFGPKVFEDNITRQGAPKDAKAEKDARSEEDLAAIERILARKESSGG